MKFFFSSLHLLIFFLLALLCGTFAQDETPFEATDLPANPPVSLDEACTNCDPNAECSVGLEGYKCQCKPGFQGDGHFCEDIDECLDAPCDRQAKCTNTDGSFYCTCDEGYEGDGFTCQLSQKGTFQPKLPDDEQQEVGEPGLFLHLKGNATIHIDQLEAQRYKDPGWEVKKRGGEPSVASVWYDLPQDLNRGIVGTYVIEYFAEDTEGNKAEPRFRTVIVTDIDECEQKLDHCSENADCINTIGSYECICKSGFEGDGYKCHDVDECKLGTHTCSAKANCTNTIGSYKCTCIDGYEGDGETCTDIDECLRNTHKCSEHATCINLEGGYDCECDKGYVGNGYRCEPIDSCEQGTHDCHEFATCTKTPDGFQCKCKRGYVGNGRNCIDINECEDPEMYSCPPHAHCENTIGSYRCDCDQGFEKGEDEYMCQDIDECERETHNCSPHALCQNLVGSFDCTCKEGFTGDGRVCTPTERPLDITLQGTTPLRSVLRQTRP